MVYWYCVHGISGGLGDRIKGMVQFLLWTMLSPVPRGFFIDCVDPLPFTVAWQPRASAHAPQWVPPAAARAIADAIREGGKWSGTIPAGADGGAPLSFRKLGWTSTLSGLVSTGAAMRSAREDVLYVFGNGLQRVGFAPEALPEAEQLADWRSLLNAWAGRGQAPPLPPELALLANVTTGAAVTEEAVGRSCAGDALVPGTIQLGEKAGSGSLQLALQLMDWLVQPSPSLLQRVAGLGHHYAPGEQYVVAIHARVGTPMAGAAYTDPSRDSPAHAMRVLRKCSSLALGRLVTRFGPRPRSLFFVSSDDWAVRDGLLAELQGAAIHGTTASAIATRAKRPTHVDKTDWAALGAAEAEADLLDMYADFTLLGAAHAMVRSRSGFSEVAEEWARIPLVYEVVYFSDECVDRSEEAIWP
jgi:hypothetical protein